jgi:hypothetical protein
MKKQDILISVDLKEYYAVNSENRKSVVIIEMINAADNYTSSLMIIIKNQNIMLEQRRKKLKGVDWMMGGKGGKTPLPPN